MQSKKKGLSAIAQKPFKEGSSGQRFPNVSQIRMRVTAKPVIRKDVMGPDGMAPVIIQVIVNRKVWKWSMDFRWPVKAFADRCLKRTKSDQEADDKNLILEQALARINEIEVSYRLRNQVLDMYMLKQELFSYESKKCFIQFIDTEISNRLQLGEIQQLTAKIHRQTLYRLHSVFKSLPFNELNVSHGLTYNKAMQKSGLSESTIATHHKVIRIYLRRAIAEGLTKNDFMKGIKTAPIKNRIEYLSAAQVNGLLQLYQACLPGTMKEVALRLFLFSCFSGLRISDLRRLHEFVLVEDTLVFAPQKNNRKGKILTVPLNKPALQLYTAIKSADWKLYSEQKMNACLTKVGQEMGLAFHLTFHVARHTFATLFLEKGGNVEVLQQLLGHSNIRYTMIYSHISDKRKREQIDLMDGIVSSAVPNG